MHTNLNCEKGQDTPLGYPGVSRGMRGPQTSEPSGKKPQMCAVSENRASVQVESHAWLPSHVLLGLGY